MKRLLFVVFLLLIHPHVKAQQFFTIGGVVKDATGKPLALATVFIDGSKRITATNDKGEFRFRDVEPGTYQLVVNMVGFYSVKQTVNVQNQHIVLNLSLKEKEETLKEVVISFDPRRAGYMALFIKNFLGTTENAAGCEILNTEILKFKENKKDNALEATSDDFLIIMNQKLGYKIKYLLRKFSYNRMSTVASYDGELIFENIEGSDQEESEWIENRKNAYKGSLMQYMRALFQGKTVDLNFITYQVSGTQTKLVDVNSFVKLIDSNFISLAFKNSLYIRYDSSATQVYQQGTHQFTSKMGNDGTLLRLYLKRATIDKKGSYVDFRSFLVKGYWGGKRIGDQLPFEYQE
ncbi:carboxypeptidase-like regulatory domain-containing protein [Pedobacter frigoris]|uniref:Carboxypeptidase-like regulatory domain-containing protein n=1 Tax=Pedobacter frigoris TaxID=2571272 RepID=A0A4U1CNF4_9SPHI|nr:carboxypeptidase-like regulatory domain-containing protein [Pedobacter frigoris]TKC08973.1 carboxypeptidase-like regulatory domain-containing protein [Pedobacter frigoris]